MKIGIYVGSFNPVHKAHVKIVNHLLKYLDKIIVIPTGNYWDKNDLISVEHRINMWKFYQNEKIIIDENYNDLKYTYLILNELNKIYPNDELYLIIGADNLIDFDKWQNYQDILKHQLLIINRDNIDTKYYLNKFNIKNYIIVSDLENQNISSTMIRDLLKTQNIKELNKLIDSKALDYIIKYNLYQ